MAGENFRSGALAPEQPGGRAPAPGGLALVQSFINTHYDLEFEHGADLFATAASLGSWLQRRGLIAEPRPRPDAADLRRAVAIRETLRALARENEDRGGPNASAARRRLNEASAGAAVEIRFADAGPRFVPVAAAGVDGAFGVVLALAATAMIDGSWGRLKVCPGEDCGWAFYDHSRNQSGRWCSMAVCGGRAKARAHYWRRRREPSSER
jgi:predicted RNA-binding Zn ribbon-like protein